MANPTADFAKDDRPLEVQQVVEEVAKRREQGESLPDEEVIAQHPRLMPELGEKLKALGEIVEVLNQPPGESDRGDATGGETPTLRTTVSGQGAPSHEEEDPAPNQIGRYEIRERLGGGGFGTVYLGFDTELQREVAIKVPRRKRIQEPADVEAFLTEARLVARLDHPHIVPVYDVGRTEDGPCYIVSKLIDGSDLRKRITSHNSDYHEAAALIATVAEALQYAHGQEIAHRDIKPENILLDGDGRPYIADFGLALKDENFGEGSGYAGTPLYWSPEQARGEGHRVDGRSDIFSLGIVFYELLAGKRPFRGSTADEVADRIRNVEARPPRQLDGAIPKELERICLKALSKRATDRYTAAMDMAADLRRFLETPELVKQTDTAAAVDDKQRQPVRIVPKGLRSFDEEDANFFLELLPGPRDWNGLPESIRFWKSRIEQTDPDKTFQVGLLYGPSGCGKSSLVKAGLLPRLADHVISIYVEATAGETENRLLKSLQKLCPDVPADLSLIDALTALRRGEGISAGKKVLIVLDQFEQWLHARAGGDQTQLVAALRQCDGGNVQALVLVRDDFYLGVNRFFQQLEERLLEGHNQSLVDLFDPDHAEKVLTAFGRAYGKLDEAELTAEQITFLDAAVAGLAEGGKVVCVRLAVFAEMMKGKPWAQASLREVGGTEGIGFTFLEETFAARTAPPNYRSHQEGIRAVLNALLPEQGTDIKGRMQPYQQLLEAAKYEGRSAEFGALLGILDREVRLITPTEPDESDGDLPTEQSAKYYQLSHDYLVPSLRRWLRQKETESCAGRARIRLVDRAALWKAKPETQQLPPAWEYVNIRALTQKRDWTDAQRGMMSAAKRYYGILTAVLIALSVFAWGGRELAARMNSSALVNSLAKAGESKVLEVVNDLQDYMPWVRERLQQLTTLEPKTPDETRQQLHARLTLVATDENQVPALFESLLTASPGYVGVIRDALRPYKEQLTEDLWQEFHAESGSADRRFRAGLALANYVTGSEKWKDDDYRFLTEQLLLENPKDQPVWLGYLHPVSNQCMPHWERLFSDTASSESELLAAANALAEFTGDDQQRIARSLTVANPKQYPILFPRIASSPSEATKRLLAKIAAELPPDDLPSIDRVPFGQRRAGAGITLLRLGERESVLPTLDMTDDPEAVTQFIHRCRDRGVHAAELLECLHVAESSSLSPQASSRTRYTLLLALGDYLLSDIPDADRDSLIAQLGDWYEHDPSSAVHGASGWLLRQWDQDEIVRRVDQTPVPYAADREWFTLAITVTSPRRARTSGPREDDGGATEKEQSTPSSDDEPATSSDKTSKQAATDDADTADDASSNDEPSEKDSAADETERANGSNASSGDARHAEEEPKLAPQTFHLTFLVFPAGEYRIGSMSDEPDRNEYKTRHAARFTRPFALLDRELTFAELIAFDRQYASIMQHLDREPADAGSGPNWYDAVDFCRWLTEQAGFSEKDQAYPDPATLDEKQFPREPNPAASWAPRNWPVRLDRRGFRLPTEAEWEVACRAGTRTTYGQGTDIGFLRHYAWYAENSGKHVHPPKTRRPGLRGQFDMHGNLIEWVHDWYSAYDSEAVVDPKGPGTGSYRVYRGGGWGDGAAGCRSSLRNSSVSPAYRGSGLGSRLALVPSSKDVERQESSDNRGAEARRERSGAATGGAVVDDGGG